MLIGGPTASQKTELAINLAKKIPAVIINADTMQFYKDFKILNNRPNNILSCKTEFRLFGSLEIPNFPNLGWWNRIIRKEIARALKKKKLPIIVGGTGLYLNAIERETSFVPKIKNDVKKEISQLHKKFGLKYLYKILREHDELSFNNLNPNDTYRIIRALEVKKSTGRTLDFWKQKVTDNNLKKKLKYYYAIINPERDKLYKKIDSRFLKMIENGAIEEVKLFKKKKVSSDHPIFKMIGLKYLINYLDNNISLNEAIFFSQRDTRRYAKRQITWFKNQPLNANRFMYNEAVNFFSLSTCKNYFLF